MGLAAECSLTFASQPRVRQVRLRYGAEGEGHRRPRDALRPAESILRRARWASDDGMDVGFSRGGTLDSIHERTEPVQETKFKTKDEGEYEDRGRGQSAQQRPREGRGRGLGGWSQASPEAPGREVPPGACHEPYGHIK